MLTAFGQEGNIFSICRSTGFYYTFCRLLLRRICLSRSSLTSEPPETRRMFSGVSDGCLLVTWEKDTL